MKEAHEENKPSAFRYAFAMAAMIPAAALTLGAVFGPVAAVAGATVMSLAGGVALGALSRGKFPDVGLTFNGAVGSGLMAAGAGIAAAFLSPAAIGVATVSAVSAVALALGLAANVKRKSKADEADAVYKDTLTGIAVGSAIAAVMMFMTAGKVIESLPPPPKAPEPSAPAVRSEMKMPAGKIGEMKLAGYRFSLPGAA